MSPLTDKTMMIRLSCLALIILLACGTLGAWASIIRSRRAISQAEASIALLSKSTDQTTDKAAQPTATPEAQSGLPAQSAGAKTSSTLKTDHATSKTTGTATTASAKPGAPPMPPGGMPPGGMPPGMQPGMMPPGQLAPGMPGRPGQPGAPGGAVESRPFPEALVSLLKSKPLFGLQPKPPLQVQGVLGDSAFMNGQWVKVGSQNGPYKLIAVYPDKVIIEEDGQRREQIIWAPIPGASPPQSAPPGGPPRPSGPQPSAKPPEGARPPEMRPGGPQPGFPGSRRMIMGPNGQPIMIQR